MSIPPEHFKRLHCCHKVACVIPALDMEILLKLHKLAVLSQMQPRMKGYIVRT